MSAADHPTAPVPGTTTRETPTMLEVWDALEADYRTRKAAWEESGREGPRPAMGELPTCMTCGKPWTPYSRRPAFQPEAALRICVCRQPLPAPVSPSSEPTPEGDAMEWLRMADRELTDVQRIADAVLVANRHAKEVTLPRADLLAITCMASSAQQSIRAYPDAAHEHPVSPADPTRDTTQRTVGAPSLRDAAQAARDLIMCHLTLRMVIEDGEWEAVHDQLAAALSASTVTSTVIEGPSE